MYFDPLIVCCLQQSRIKLRMLNFIQWCHATPRWPRTTLCFVFTNSTIIVKRKYQPLSDSAYWGASTMKIEPEMEARVAQHTRNYWVVPAMKRQSLTMLNNDPLSSLLVNGEGKITTTIVVRNIHDPTNNIWNKIENIVHFSHFGPILPQLGPI